MCADIAIHDTGTGNPHAHILLTMRPFNEDKTWGDKQKKVYHFDDEGNKIYDPIKRQYKCNKVQTTDWNEQTKAEEWRAAWANTANRYLEKLNHAERLDHRSYARQGIDQMPTIHLGAAASQMEKRGIRTERGEINREIEVINRKLCQIAEQINELQGWLEEEKTNPTPPTFADVISDILSRQGQVVVNTPTATHILNFLKAKQIEDYAGIETHLKDLMSKQREISYNLSPVRKRIEEITELCNRYDDYKKHKAEYEQYIKDYNSQRPWKRKKFEENNSFIIRNYESSKGFIERVKNDKNQIPTNAWKKEYIKLNAELRNLTGEYQSLKDEVSAVDKVRVKVYDILRKERQREQPIKKRSQDFVR